MEHAIDSILTGLSLDEKIGQLVQYSVNYSTGPGGVRTLAVDPGIIKAGRAGSFFNVFGTEETRKLQRLAVEESRAKIPLIFGLDVIHGFKTTFPIPLAMSTSWDPAVIERATRVEAEEASAAGIQWTFAPMIDIARDARWGRIAEGSGEDPYLGSLLAVAAVRGFQGSTLTNPSSIVACPKHYAAYGAAEAGKDYNTVDISERTLRDVYLPPFKAAVNAGAGTIMASFNEIGGVPSSANHFLLTEVLRNEWKFDGFVVSDWNSIGELVPHGVAVDGAQAATLAIKAGVDMDMMSGFYRDNLTTLVKQGKVDVKAIDEAVRRILRIKMRLGLFTDPYRAGTPEREKSVTMSAANRRVAREVAQRSIVLLKNAQNILPLKKTLKSIAVIGPLAASHHDPIGTWAGPTDTNTVITVLEGIRNVLPSASIRFERGCDIESTDTTGFAPAVAAARDVEAVVLVLGESLDMSGEACSRSSLGLPGNQQLLLNAVLATGKPLVLVLMNGRPLAITWEAEHVPTILETWFLGTESGNAIADVLFGDVNPSGRLTTSFPRVVGQVPIYYNHKNTGRPTDDQSHFTSRYLDVPSTPLFPFGYGLSYTTFSYSDLAVANQKLSKNDTLVVHVALKNTGAVAGDETVQLYVRDDVGSVTRPVRELKAFQRVHLNAGQSTVVALSVPVQELAFTGLDMKKAVEPGSFHVYVGPNAAEGLERTFVVTE